MHGLQALSLSRIHVLHEIQETSFLNVELCEEPRSNAPKQQPTAQKQQLVELVSEPKIAHAKLSVTGDLKILRNKKIHLLAFLRKVIKKGLLIRILRNKKVHFSEFLRKAIKKIYI